MKSFKVEGIIIKRRNFGEADKILTVLTKTTGKIQVKAPGVRRIPSRRSAHVELLNHSVLNLYKGRNNPILTEAQTIEGFSALKNDLDAIGTAYHICELIDGLCPENQENMKVFYLLKNMLKALSERSVQESLSQFPDPQCGKKYYSPQENISWPAYVREGQSAKNNIRQFEIELLSLLGYLPPEKQDRYLSADNFDTRNFIENILERKLKSANIFSKL